MHLFFSPVYSVTTENIEQTAAIPEKKDRVWYCRWTLKNIKKLKQASIRHKTL